MKQDRARSIDSLRGRPVAADDLVALWQAHRHWVAAVLHAHRPRQPGAPELEDLLQEVAMVLVRKQPELSRIESVEPWLRTIAVTIARDAGRRIAAAGRANRHLVQDLTSDGLADRPGEADTTPSRAKSALAIVESLPMTYAEPLLLSLRGLSYRQISIVMDLPPSTIQNRLHRARAMVREELAAAAEPSLHLAEAQGSTCHE